MRFVAGVFFAIILIGIVSGENLTYDFDDKVCIGDEFFVNVDYNRVADWVKIDIVGAGGRIGRIWNGEKWASTIYYIDCGIADCQRVRMLAKRSGRGNITIKVRSEDTLSFDAGVIYFEECDKKDIRADTDDKIIEIEKDNYFSYVKYNESVKKIKRNITLNPINISPKTIKTDKNLVELLNKNKKYSILIFLIVLGVLYFKDKGDKNEYEW